MTIESCCIYHVFPEQSTSKVKCTECFYDESNKKCQNYQEFNLSQLVGFYNEEAITILKIDLEKRINFRQI